MEWMSGMASSIYIHVTDAVLPKKKASRAWEAFGLKYK